MSNILIEHNAQLLQLKSILPSLNENTSIELDKYDELLLTYNDIKEYLSELSKQDKRYIVIENPFSFIVNRLADNASVKRNYEIVSNETSNPEILGVNEILRICDRYNDYPIEKLTVYGITKELKESNLIPYSFFQRTLSATVLFRKYHKGPTVLLKTCLDKLVNTGRLDFVKSEHTASKCYKLKSPYEGA